VAIVTAHNRARHNVLQHRNVTGHYRDANDHTAHIAATYGACTEFVGLLGQEGRAPAPVLVTERQRVRIVGEGMVGPFFDRGACPANLVSCFVFPVFRRT